MRVYDCVVRLAGELNNEVPKVGVTAAEVYILRSIHGSDAVVRIEPRGMDRRDHKTERDRLAQRYGEARLVELFGMAHNKLPVELNDEDEALIAEHVAEKEQAADQATRMSELEDRLALAEEARKDAEAGLESANKQLEDLTAPAGRETLAEETAKREAARLAGVERAKAARAAKAA